MKLTKELLAKLPRQYTQTKIAYLHFYSPSIGWNWWATGFSKKYQEFYGYVKGIENEWGSFSIEQLNEFGAFLDEAFVAMPAKEFPISAPYC